MLSSANENLSLAASYFPWQDTIKGVSLLPIFRFSDYFIVLSSKENCEEGERAKFMHRASLKWSREDFLPHFLYKVSLNAIKEPYNVCYDVEISSAKSGTKQHERAKRLTHFSGDGFPATIGRKWANGMEGWLEGEAGNRTSFYQALQRTMQTCTRSLSPA